MKQYLGTPFSIEAERIDNGKGYWGYQKITVYRDGTPIGGYTRTYETGAERTFHPFQVGTEWYALYSAQYTATRVARLTDTFEDWCGETPSAGGFCPVEFFVPMNFTEHYTNKTTGEDLSYNVWLDGEYEDEAEFFTDATGKSIQWANYGFVSGCQWGDDTSWKLRYIDLSKIPDKVLTIQERFGYWELADNMGIRQSIRLFEYDGMLTLTGRFAMNLNRPVPNTVFADGFFPNLP